MRDNVRKGSEGSDETGFSQETISTILSDNFEYSTISPKPNSFSGSNAENGIVTFDLEDTDETNASLPATTGTETDSVRLPVGPVLNCPGEFDTEFRYKKDNEKRKETSTLSCRQYNRPKYQSSKSSSYCLSRDNEPLIEHESINSDEDLLQGSKETNEDNAPTSHAKTYPEVIKRENCNFTPCVCGKNYNSNNVHSSSKTIMESYNRLKEAYRKTWKIFLVLAILDVCLLAAVPSVCLSRHGMPHLKPSSIDDAPGYNICFDCTDLEHDPNFSAQTLRGVYRKMHRCCFDSITSVYLSLKQIFQNLIEDRMKSLNYSIKYLQTLMLNGVTGKRNLTTDYIIKRILMLNTPKEKTAVHLVSKDGPPEEENSMSGVFHKLRWKTDGDKIVLRKADLRKGLNLQIQSEGYYFLYTRIHFKIAASRKNLTVNYSINRQRGSTSTYIHEAKESCQAAGFSLEHSGVAEMVVHLIRNDEIFISVSKSDIKYLSTEAGAHFLGLFEL